MPCIFPAGVPAASSLAVGVGHIVRATTLSRFGNLSFALFCMFSAAIALQLRGVGHSLWLTCVAKFGIVVPLLYFFIRALNFSRSVTLSLAVGVSHNPDPVASVRGIDGASWNNKWRGLIPEAFQVRKAAREAQRLVNKASHIFANDPLRPYVCNKGSHDRPEVAVIFCASLLPGCGPRLTRKAAAEDVNSSISICINGSNVVVDRDIGPVLSEDGLAEGVLFTEGNCPKRSGCFKPEAEAPDPAKEIKDGEVFF
jgi:hypothetical protein